MAEFLGQLCWRVSSKGTVCFKQLLCDVVA
jgi:hypothetical protein